MDNSKAEHILACLSSSPTNAKIIRTAAQMARAFGGKFTALYVKTPDSNAMSRENLERLQNHIRLAEDLGAEIATVYGEDIAQQIIEFSRLSKVTKLVLGRSNVIGRALFKRQSLTDKIIRGANELNVYIIPDSEAKAQYRLHGISSLISVPRLSQILLMLLSLFAATGSGFLLRALDFTETSIMAVYMLGAITAALLTRNFMCCAVYSFAGVLFFNFLFAEPRLSFLAYEWGSPVTFAVMLISALIAATLASRLSRSAELSANAAYRTNIMLETNRLLQNAESDEEVINILAHQLGKLLSRNIVVYSASEDGALGVPRSFPLDVGARLDALLSEGEGAIAKWVYENRRRAGIGTDRFTDSAGVYFSLRTDERSYGVVGIEVGNRSIEPFENSILLSILAECAMTMDNLKNAREKEEIALVAKNEQLRANLLRAISHDLRTPLTSISGNTENLLANIDNIDTDTRKALLTDINDDAEWLISLVENLLSVSRISEGRMNINMSSQLVDEVIVEALRHSSRKAKSRKTVTEFSDELLLAKMDARLITQVIINLVDNAIKYTPDDTEIKISAKGEGDYISVSVADLGPGIPDSQKKDVFKMFYTITGAAADCRRSLGLGLSLCDSIINAHGGRLTLQDNYPCGCIFKFTLKRSEINLNEQ